MLLLVSLYKVTFFRGKFLRIFFRHINLKKVFTVLLILVAVLCVKNLFFSLFNEVTDIIIITGGLLAFITRAFIAIFMDLGFMLPTSGKIDLDPKNNPLNNILYMKGESSIKANEENSSNTENTSTMQEQARTSENKNVLEGLDLGLLSRDDLTQIRKEL
jgi:hypothetical protein